MLGLFQRKKKTDEEIKKERIENLNAMLEKAPKLKKLVAPDQRSGWAEFCALLDDYADKCKKRKAITALDKATDAEIYQLKLLDHEVFLINWIKQIPEQFISQTENQIKKQAEEEGDK